VKLVEERESYINLNQIFSLALQNDIPDGLAGLVVVVVVVAQEHFLGFRILIGPTLE
jgi:hypothetical protein